MYWLFLRSKIEFVDIGKAFACIIQASFWPSTSIGIGGPKCEIVDLLLVVQHASRNVTVLALIHFECCMARLIKLLTLERYKNNNKSILYEYGTMNKIQCKILHPHQQLL